MDNFEGYILLFLVVIVTGALLARISRRRRFQSVQPTPTQRDLAQESQDEIRRLIVELQEIGRELYGRLDTRIQHLEQLLADADQRITELKTSGVSDPIQQLVPLEEPKPRNIGPELETRYASIYSLADQGLSIAQIAQETSRLEGEIELIMRLRHAAKSESIVE